MKGVASLPWRRSRGVILLYHRVADVQHDPLQLAVSPARFAEQLDVVKRLTQPTALADIRAVGGRRAATAVTFDDGYVDNLDNAAPLLEAAGIPATVFVISGLVGASATGPWWDEVVRALLGAEDRPSSLDVTIGGEMLAFAFDHPHVDDPNWDILSEEMPSARHRALVEILGRLRLTPPPERDRVVEMIRDWADLRDAPGAERIVDAEELRRLDAWAGIEVGAHTVNHPGLAVLPVAEQRDEIRGSKQRLEDLLGRTVTSFSYPHGTPWSYTQETVGLAREAGFELACANVEGHVRRGTDPFELPRFIVRDWDGEEFERRLRAWIG